MENNEKPNDKKPDDKDEGLPQDTPKWARRFLKLIYKHWQYHAMCKHINTQAYFDKEHDAWQFKAAPVYQEVLGGEDDGQKVWAGFLFDVGEFGRNKGVYIADHALQSFCGDCNNCPKMMVKGKFEGHSFYLQIYMEPVADTEPVEILDTIKEEIREFKASPKEE